LQHTLKPLVRGAGIIRSHLKSGAVALLFGSEKTGLSNDDLSHCDWLMHIPTRKEHLSMNLGQAVAVCMYELSRDSHYPETRFSGKKAKAATLELLSKALLDVLRESGYTKPSTEVATEERTRRMLRRLQLSGKDAELWLGMLRQIAWKIGSKSGH
jgi:tRNA C32,U32 (ribose-2'-O)-methylase TrmJ